jgi:hypothetical protein
LEAFHQPVDKLLVVEDKLLVLLEEDKHLVEKGDKLLVLM